MKGIVLAIAVAASPIPDAAKQQYSDAAAKMSAGEYGPANDILNKLAGEYPRWPELYASRCSAQLGLKHWEAAVADCKYALALKPKLPAAVYGLAVAEDGRGHLADAAKVYREYIALEDPAATQKSLAQSRAEVIEKRLNVQKPAVPNANFQAGIPSPGRMLLYVFRNVAADPDTAVTFQLDGKDAGELPHNSYVELDLAPGDHTMVVKAGRLTATHKLSSAEGDVSYVKLDPGLKPVPVKGDVGRKEIREDCHLNGSRKL